MGLRTDPADLAPGAEDFDFWAHCVIENKGESDLSGIVADLVRHVRNIQDLTGMR